MSIDLQAITKSVTEFAQEGTDFIYFAALVAGCVLAFMSLMDLVKKGQTSAGMATPPKSWGSILGRLVIASCLVTLATKLDMVIATNGSTEGIRTALAYAKGTTASAGNNTLQLIWAAISAWAVFMGMVGFMRAFLLFDKASQGGHDSGDAMWRGFWHLIGGALVINIFSNL